MATVSLSSPSPALSDSQRHQVVTRRWIDFLLIGFMLVNLALSLDAAEWSPGLDHLIIITSLAVIAGTLVAISDFGAWFAFLYGVITGAAAILYSLSDLATGAVTGQEAVYQIVDRTIIWLHNAFSGQPGADTIVFVLLLAILLWILSLNATWVYFREGRKWQAVLPTGLAILVNLYYAPKNLNAYFVLYLVTAMLLILRATLAERQERWYEKGVYFPFDIGFDVMRDGIVFILLVITISWVLPATLHKDNQEMVNPLEDPLKQVKEEWNRLFNTLNYGDGGSTPPTVVFTASHLLGGARSVTNEPVMDVATSLNRYFQATVLDTYTSRAWELRNTVEVNLETQRVPTPKFKARRFITQTVTMRQMTNVIMGAPMPIRVSIPANARVIPYGLTPEETMAAEQIGVSELSLILSQDIIQPGQAYTITSAISFATEAQLRSDETDYPVDVTARYLQLPDTVPQRVFDLADELAHGYENPYDIAKAIETYVRGYKYNDQIPGPAPDQDAADYFLFEEKQGYCDYYATSMAVMLRHLGIPTRLAQGYATGEYDSFTGAYRFLEKDAHTWVEVYFPTYGWIQFEPTASEEVIERQPGAVIPPEEGGSRASAYEKQQEEDEERNIPVPEETIPKTGLAGRTSGLTQRLAMNLGRGLLIVTAVGLLIVGILFWRLVRMPGPQTKLRKKKRQRDFMGRLWERLWWWGEHLGVTMRSSLTPLEQAEAFARAVPDTADDVLLLAKLYAREQYSPYALAADDLDRAQYAWLKLRSLFIRTWLNRRLHLVEQIRFWQ